MEEKSPTPNPKRVPPTTSENQCSPNETRVKAIKNATSNIIPSFNHLVAKFSPDKKMIQKVNATTDFYLQKLQNKKLLKLEEVIDVSFDFAVETGLLRDKRVIDVINQIRELGGVATMAILGQVVITNMKPTFIKDYKIVELVITNKHL